MLKSWRWIIQDLSEISFNASIILFAYSFHVLESQSGMEILGNWAPRTSCNWLQFGGVVDSGLSDMGKYPFTTKLDDRLESLLVLSSSYAGDSCGDLKIAFNSSIHDW